MGTRGAYGFKLDNELKVTYNHFDSYLEGLGQALVDEIKDIKEWEKVKDVVKNIILVTDDERPTKELKNIYSKYGDSSVGRSAGNTGIKTWYQLLRGVQGTVLPYVNGEVTHMIDGKDFIKDTLFCEYAYIINLDNMSFEITIGNEIKEIFELNDELGEKFEMFLGAREL